MDAEFEEKEYEMPLNAQLSQGNSNLWTPGQVFEGHFGIDAAIKVSRVDFWNTIGFLHPLDGLILNDFNFGYVWKRAYKNRQLPTFKLNLFLQTKRPEGLKNRTSKLKQLGLQSPYWRFEIKPHQQKLLFLLKRKLGNRAFVAYGCSAFHLYNDLYTHTTNNTLVQNSTFVKVDKMNNHSKWVYDSPGSNGIALSEPKLFSDEVSLFDEISNIQDDFTVENDEAQINLKIISDSLLEICKELRNENIIANEIIKRFDTINSYSIPDYQKKFISTLVFSQLLNLKWAIIK